MGALTSKVYAFKYRSWDLISHESIDLSTSLATPILIQMQENKPIRILPLIKKAEQDDFITNDTRYSYDSEYNNRIIKLQKSFLYRTKDNMKNLFLPTTISSFTLAKNDDMQILTGNKI